MDSVGLGLWSFTSLCVSVWYIWILESFFFFIFNNQYKEVRLGKVKLQLQLWNLSSSNSKCLLLSQTPHIRKRVASPLLLIPVVLTRTETVQNAERRLKLTSELRVCWENIGSRGAVLPSWGQKDLFTRISENLGSWRYKNALYSPELRGPTGEFVVWNSHWVQPSWLVAATVGPGGHCLGSLTVQPLEGILGDSNQRALKFLLFFRHQISFPLICCSLELEGNSRYLWPEFEIWFP